MKSLWKQYNEELGGYQLIEEPWGFVGYTLAPDHLYIHDVYIVPEERGNGRSKELQELLMQKAKEAGKDFLVGQVQMFSKTKIESLKHQLALGYEPFEAHNGVLKLKKEVL